MLINRNLFYGGKSKVIPAPFRCGYKPRLLIRNTHPTRSLSQFVATPGVYYTSKCIIVFTMIYCSMNWLSYKQSRELFEKEENQNDIDDKDIQDKH